MGKASTRAQNRYIAKAYDRINLTVAKGQKEIIQAYAAAQGESVNGFINRAISETMERNAPRGLQESARGREVALSSREDKAAPAASEGQIEGG